jgi:hypothetical protein
VKHLLAEAIRYYGGNPYNFVCDLIDFCDKGHKTALITIVKIIMAIPRS